MNVSFGKHRDRYEKAVLNAAPLVSYARLHLIVPIALFAAVGCVLIGLLLPQGRQLEGASRLIEAAPTRHAYEAQLMLYHQHRGRNWARAAQRRRLVDLARAAHLNHCRWSDLGERSQVACDGRVLKDRLLTTSFWLLLACSAIALFGWLYIQFRDSWMLPYWSPRLWYTPIYASVVGLICCGPFLMVAAYYAKAEAIYVVPPRGWPVGEPGILLFALGVLQVAAIALAGVERRPRAAYFAIGAGVLAAVALATYVLLQLFLSQARDPQLFSLFITVQVLFLAAVALASRFIRSAWMVRRVAALCPALAVAWISIALRGVFEGVGAGSSTMDTGVEALCYLAIGVHLWSSQASELGLWRLGRSGAMHLRRP